MKWVEIEGQRVAAEVIAESLWFHWLGVTYQVPFGTKKSRHKSSQHTNDSGEILAPMPGKITQVRVNVGESVSAGQVVLVMEAMKMEYTLKSPIGGKVVSVECQPGQQVVAEATLAVIAAESVGTHSTGTHSASTDSAETNSNRLNSTGSKSPGSNLTGSNLTGSNLTGSNSSGTKS